VLLKTLYAGTIAIIFIIMKNSSNSKMFVGLALLAFGAVIILVLFMNGDRMRQADDLQGSGATSTDGSTSGESAQTPSSKPAGSTSGIQVGLRRVTYTDAGFSPSLIELTAGQEIEFVNRSSGGLWVTTKQHPTAGDQGYEAFDSGRTLKQGEKFVFSFTRPGTWGYKNLNNDGHIGAVVVVPQR
jgi:plastocyanin